MGAIKAGELLWEGCLFRLKKVRTSGVRITITTANCANVRTSPADVSHETLKCVKSGGGSLSSPSYNRQILVLFAAIYLLLSRCHAGCSRSDGSG